MKTPTGTILCNTYSSDTIEKLKHEIHDIKGIPPSQQTLTFNDKPLKDSRILNGHNIHGLLLELHTDADHALATQPPSDDGSCYDSWCCNIKVHVYIITLLHTLCVCFV